MVAAQLNKISKKTVVGDLKLLETIIYEEVLSSVNFDFVIAKPVIIKGCSNKPVPETAYISLANKIQDKAISIMYGEACSAVPIIKNKNFTKNILICFKSKKIYYSLYFSSAFKTNSKSSPFIFLAIIFLSGSTKKDEGMPSLLKSYNFAIGSLKYLRFET